MKDLLLFLLLLILADSTGCPLELLLVGRPAGGRGVAKDHLAVSCQRRSYCRGMGATYRLLDRRISWDASSIAISITLRSASTLPKLEAAMKRLQTLGHKPQNLRIQGCRRLRSQCRQLLECWTCLQTNFRGFCGDFGISGCD